jgi:hypothetical protein
MFSFLYPKLDSETSEWLQSAYTTLSNADSKPTHNPFPLKDLDMGTSPEELLLSLQKLSGIQPVPVEIEWLGESGANCSLSGQTESAKNPSGQEEDRNSESLPRIQLDAQLKLQPELLTLSLAGFVAVLKLKQIIQYSSDQTLPQLYGEYPAQCRDLILSYLGYGPLLLKFAHVEVGGGCCRKSYKLTTLSELELIYCHAMYCNTNKVPLKDSLENLKKDIKGTFKSVRKAL